MTEKHLTKTEKPAIITKEPRADLMIDWLERNRHRVDRMVKGSLTFNYAGPNLTWKLQEGPGVITGKV